MIKRQAIPTSGEYRATWWSAQGQVSGTVYVKVKCPAHQAEYPYCVMLGPMCYPPREFRLIARIEESPEGSHAG
jgi:hypothetical protein